jgi:hypothetical protein
MKNLDSLDIFLKVLNEAYKADPDAIHSLICNRVPCNLLLANHPTIQVDTNDVAIGGTWTVGLLGVINGICEEVTGERVAVMFSEPDIEGRRKVVGFTQYRKTIS